MELHLRMVRMIIVLLSAGLISVTCEPEPVDNNNESSHSELEKQVPAAIQLSYDTGEGNDRAFRHEERIPDGGVKGSYGYHDENGNLVVRHYIADKNGYRIVKEERHPLSSRKETEFSDKFERNDQIYESNTANYSSIFYGSDLHDTPESTNQRNDLHNANHSPDSTNFRYDLNDRKLSRNTPEVTNSRNDFYDKKLPPTIPVSINKEASSFHDNTQLYDGYYPIQQEPRPRDELHDQLSRRLNNDGKFQSPDYNRGGDIFNDGYYPIQQEPRPRDELHDQLSRRLNNDGKFQSPDYNRVHAYSLFIKYAPAFAVPLIGSNAEPVVLEINHPPHDSRTVSFAPLDVCNRLTVFLNDELRPIEVVLEFLYGNYDGQIF
ncbi:uncharacterized protein LOC106478359 [Limulus polyphemus]|uniref:Uncharacterized protein LOC106478359 n=1 Tax=Limulus polyphemus TaxID=6850 RepID=A0ABM1S207_LIMPO|nr:uncharacterized protein LOC106478359 [Limulus polyphemus]